MIDSRASQPLTGNPRSNRMRASALIPGPAMPTMCTQPRSASAGIRSVAALRTSAAPGAFQSSGRSPAWSAVVGHGPHEANLRRWATAVSTYRARTTSASGAPAADAWADIAAIRSG